MASAGRGLERGMWDHTLHRPLLHAHDLLVLAAPSPGQMRTIVPTVHYAPWEHLCSEGQGSDDSPICRRDISPLDYLTDWPICCPGSIQGLEPHARGQERTTHPNLK